MENGERPAHPALESEHTKVSMGLTKREYFAAIMLQGSIQNWNDQHIPEGVKRAIIAADELLKQLEL